MQYAFLFADNGFQVAREPLVLKGNLINLKAKTRKMYGYFSCTLIRSFHDKFFHRCDEQLSLCGLKTIVYWHDFNPIIDCQF